MLADLLLFSFLIGPFGHNLMKLRRNSSMPNLVRRAACRAFTLIELVTTTAIGATVIGGSIYGYVIAAQRAEWSAYSLAANSLALQRLEQCRSAKWDPMGYPPIDELVQTNFPVRVDILDIPISGTNVVYATSVTRIVTLSLNPPLKKIQVDCYWPFLARGRFTNSVMTYRAPDQ
jgi:hypothetical protein